MNEKSLLGRITINPEIMHGKPSIRNKRYAVEHILSYLAGGDSIESLLEEFLDLERDDILACIEFAFRMVQTKSVYLVGA